MHNSNKQPNNPSCIFHKNDQTHNSINFPVINSLVFLYFWMFTLFFVRSSLKENAIYHFCVCTPNTETLVRFTPYHKYTLIFHIAPLTFLFLAKQIIIHAIMNIWHGKMAISLWIANVVVPKQAFRMIRKILIESIWSRCMVEKIFLANSISSY